MRLRLVQSFCLEKDDTERFGIPAHVCDNHLAKHIQIKGREGFDVIILNRYSRYRGIFDEDGYHCSPPHAICVYQNTSFDIECGECE